MKHHWHGRFRQRGLRFTEPRRMILDVLSDTHEHLSAEEIYMRVHQIYPNVGLTTVYRNLDLLERMGVVAKFQFGDGRSRYELVKNPQKPGHHHHLVCIQCKKIIDYDDFVNEEIELLEKVEQALSQKHGFQIYGHVVQFYGVCGNCLSAS
ncbi:MAG: transcriptional repressor [Calditrichia bacterium]